ncbi:Multifunctional pyrimidine synthesis protein CAD [Chytriomyces hyalinus]|nr:Multifunctional pyrimidine synthesis protein CAD [Chytriomyces hyalinus]
MESRCFATLVTNDAYVDGAATLAHSLRGCVPVVVLVPPNALSQASLAVLYRAFDRVVYVPLWSNTRNAAQLALLGRPELHITYSKLFVFSAEVMHPFNVVAFIDADAFALDPLHATGIFQHLHDGASFAAAADVGWPDIFNSGVFVCRPSNVLFEALKWEADYGSGSFDGGDQGLLNRFFRSWAGFHQDEPDELPSDGSVDSRPPKPHCPQELKRTARLPFTFNVTPSAIYSYLPAVKEFQSNMSIIHFAGHDKPWTQARFTDGTVWNRNMSSEIANLHNMWWKIRDNLTETWKQEDQVKVIAVRLAVKITVTVMDQCNKFTSVTLITRSNILVQLGMQPNPQIIIFNRIQITAILILDINRIQIMTNIILNGVKTSQIIHLDTLRTTNRAMHKIGTLEITLNSASKAAINFTTTNITDPMQVMIRTIIRSKSQANTANICTKAAITTTNISTNTNTNSGINIRTIIIIKSLIKSATIMCQLSMIFWIIPNVAPVPYYTEQTPIQVLHTYDNWYQNGPVNSSHDREQHGGLQHLAVKETVVEPELKQDLGLAIDFNFGHEDLETQWMHSNQVDLDDDQESEDYLQITSFDQKHFDASFDFNSLRYEWPSEALPSSLSRKSSRLSLSSMRQPTEVFYVVVPKDADMFDAMLGEGSRGCSRELARVDRSGVPTILRQRFEKAGQSVELVATNVRLLIMNKSTFCNILAVSSYNDSHTNAQNSPASQSVAFDSDLASPIEFSPTKTRDSTPTPRLSTIPAKFTREPFEIVSPSPVDFQSARYLGGAASPALMNSDSNLDNSWSEHRTAIQMLTTELRSRNQTIQSLEQQVSRLAKELEQLKLVERSAVEPTTGRVETAMPVVVVAESAEQVQPDAPSQREESELCTADYLELHKCEHVVSAEIDAAARSIGSILAADVESQALEQQLRQDTESVYTAPEVLHDRRSSSLTVFDDETLADNVSLSIDVVTPPPSVSRTIVAGKKDGPGPGLLRVKTSVSRLVDSSASSSACESDLDIHTAVDSGTHAAGSSVEQTLSDSPGRIAEKDVAVVDVPRTKSTRLLPTKSTSVNSYQESNLICPMPIHISRLAAMARPLSFKAVSVKAIQRAISTKPIQIRTLASLRQEQPHPATAALKAPPAPSAPKSQPEPPSRPASLRLATGQVFHGTSFGCPNTDSISGEVVFTTSLVGYTESMTDPSYTGQILVFTQPLIGNYGVPSSQARDPFGLHRYFESNAIQCRGIIVNDYAAKYSHWAAVESLGQWCARYGIPAISGVDTRALVTLLRSRGSTLGEISMTGSSATDAESGKPIENPNAENLCSKVSTKEKYVVNPGGDVNVALVDCGVKQNILRCLAKRGATVTVVPWDHDLTKDPVKYDGVVLSNGPGDPSHMGKTVSNVKALIAQDAGKIPTPIFGICMGNQVLGMAAGYKTYKMPFGNRGHNQPAIDLTTGKCVITSQNHGYAIDDSVDVPGWAPYFRNANDASNEGIRHQVLPYSSVQFHPEACGGPLDTDYLFDHFLNEVRAFKRERKRIEPNFQKGVEALIGGRLVKKSVVVNF